MKHLISLKDWSEKEILDVLALATKVKAKPQKYADALQQKTLLMIFEKPSLRTRLSFEIGMTQLGGHAIYYDMSTSPMGGGKETIEDSIKVISRMCNIVMARLFSHSDILEMAEYATIPVINALTDEGHPCQILADLMTIQEKKGTLKGLKLAYLGDGFNNVTHSLMQGCTKLGMHISVGSPEEQMPAVEVTELCAQFARESGSELVVTDDPVEAIKDADVVYTDSWMSYHIKQEEKKQRLIEFAPFQVTKKLLSKADESVIFMNCLPAQRGYEQTAEVIDGPNSVVFDQAENRMHMQKAILLYTLGLL